jgi:3-hydroxybutyryl-CoA dehydrogenase
MKILVVGSPSNLQEFKEKFAENHDYGYFSDYSFEKDDLENADMIFDFYIGDNPEQFEVYSNLDSNVFINAPKISLAELAYYQESVSCNLYGFNGLPTFLNRSLLEVSCFDEKAEAEITSLCKELATEFIIVADRVGMVTPRVISMIINEAYFTLQEGTASIEDIDKGMKLGTNYPFGPFEWCEKIGLQNVYEVLEAIYDDTKDERYKICPLLKTEYLKA